MRRQFPLLAAALLVLPAVSVADTPVAVAPKAPPRVFVVDLSKARLAPETVYLAVSADKMAAPPSVPPLQTDDTPISIAADYGLMTDTFQNVVALAPRTMVVLNTNPGTPDPYRGMQTSDILKVLLAGLSDEQWKILTGSQGIGLDDLSSDAQKEEFLALFPTPKLHVQSLSNDNAPMTDTVLSRDELLRSHLRLGQYMSIGLPVAGKNNSEWVGAPNDFGSASYAITPYSGEDQQPATVAGATVRSIVPNAVKASDLDLDVAALRKTVPLAGLKTVDDLIAAIAKVSGYELYADRRYGGRSVTLLGQSTARGRDLLSALALCVTGTYRKVGPAYVLTDDIRGSGARKLLIQRFGATAQMLGHRMVQEAGDKVIMDHPMEKLPPLDDSTALTDEQNAEMIKEKNDPFDNFGLRLPNSKLTPSQRATVNSFAAKQNMVPGDMKVTTDGDILMTRQSALLLVVPSLPGPVSLEYYGSAGRLYEPSSKLRQKMWSVMAANMNANLVTGQEKLPEREEQKLPNLGAEYEKFPLRAIYSQARTAAEIDKLIDSMKAAKLNAIYLDVFSEGSAHIPVKELPNDSHGESDILSSAIAKTAGSGISVFPVLNLLRWSDAPEACRDLTILGETSAEADSWQSTYDGVVSADQTIEEAKQNLPPPIYSVEPLAPEVQNRLVDLARKVAHMPGISGIVFRETATSGYEHPATGGTTYSVGPEVGYTPANRLAFLRQEHVDPVDLDSPQGVGYTQADLSLPEFDDYTALGDKAGQWYTFRYNQGITFLRKLFTAVSDGGAHPPIWIQQRHQGLSEADWYGTWADPQSAPPELLDDTITNFDPNRDFSAVAHAQSSFAIRSLPMWALQVPTGLAGFGGLAGVVKQGWDGFVIMPN